MDFEKIIAEVTPTLRELESDRQIILEKTSRFYLILIIVILVAGGIALALFPIGLVAVFVASIAMGFTYQSMVGSRAAKYSSDYKSATISKILSTIDPGLKFVQDSGISEEEFRECELYSGPDRYHTEDLIYGKIDKTSIKLGEVHAEEKHTTRDSKGKKKTRYSTIFRGLILIADFNKNFNGRTFLLPDAGHNFLSNLFSKSWKGSKVAQMEDVDFESDFDVYTDDQVEARYILTPSMMSHLTTMQGRFGENVRVVFKDSCVWIAVPRSQPYMEPSTKLPATDTAQIHKMLDDMSPFLKIINELDLNTRIWTKK
ncbi:DUF3137 domain-containing protein [bacterium]|nr:DUF3137 domain-containing protein [bacterium]